VADLNWLQNPWIICGCLFFFFFVIIILIVVALVCCNGV